MSGLYPNDRGHGPHALALVLTVEQRIALTDFVRSGGHDPRRYRDLLLEIAKRVLLFQIHAEEAVIAHDHREAEIAKLWRPYPVDETLIKDLCHAWWVAGGGLEAIENGIGTVSVDWRRDVWRVVAEVAHAEVRNASGLVDPPYGKGG